LPVGIQVLLDPQQVVALVVEVELALDAPLKSPHDALGIEKSHFRPAGEEVREEA
jgi:hypothetical protein